MNSHIIKYYQYKYIEVICLKTVIIFIPKKKARLCLSILAFFIPIFLFSFYLLSSTLNKNVVPLFQNLSSKNDIDLLKAYKENDVDGVKKYFENWNEESKKLTKIKYADELEESLYKIFKVMFHPYDMKPLIREPMMGGYEKDLIEVINRTPYLVIQNQISYIFNDLNEFNEENLMDFIISTRFSRDEIKTLDEFYPLLDEDKEKVLYLTPKYQEDLTLFLGTEDQPFGERHIMGPAEPKGETGKRYQFIRNYLPILYGHWGGYWHLSTHPEIEYVFINPQLNHALAHYRIGYNFGYAELKKVNGDWIMLWANMNGIE